MSDKTLRGLQPGYYADVEHNSIGDYDVAVYKELNLPGQQYREWELLADRWMDGDATEDDLNNLVSKVIAESRSSLVGKYYPQEEGEK